MNKLFATLLMLFYLVPAIGINISIHLCSGKHASVSYFKEKEKKCFCAAGTEKKSCCEDRYQILKIDDSQQKTELFAQKFSNPFHKVFTIPFNYKPLESTAHKVVDKAVSHSTYSLYRNPIYLFNRVLRI